MTGEELNEAIKTCKWRKDVLGVMICSGICSPCDKAIKSGKCDTLIEIFKKERENERERNDRTVKPNKNDG